MSTDIIDLLSPVGYLSGKWPVVTQADIILQILFAEHNNGKSNSFLNNSLG